jgi:hypothetical protein
MPRLFWFAVPFLALVWASSGGGWGGVVLGVPALAVWTLLLRHHEASA